MKANWHGIQWVKRQPELVEKIKTWIKNSIGIEGIREKEIYYWKFICPMTGEHRAPVDMPSEGRCLICKKIWPDLIKTDFACPCFNIEIKPKEIISIAFIICHGNDTFTV